jgi:hypothetical protein
MAEAESLFRSAFIRVLETPELIETFATKKREAFLDGLAFNGAA